MDFRSSGLCLRGIFDNIEVIGRGEGAADSLPAIYISMLVEKILQCQQNLDFTTVASCARKNASCSWSKVIFEMQYKKHRDYNALCSISKVILDVQHNASKD